MTKERVGAFIDAVLAIIITILVLNLKQPSELTFEGFWAIKESLFAYLLSFFWIGIVWIMQITGWGCFKKLDRHCLLWVLVMLFSASLFPWATQIVGEHLYDLSAEVVYGINALCITLSNIGLTHAINVANGRKIFGWLYSLPNRVIAIDLLIKMAGLTIALLGFPPAVAISLLINIVFRLFYLASNTRWLGPGTSEFCDTDPEA